jgi:hypothetical protein
MVIELRPVDLRMRPHPRFNRERLGGIDDLLAILYFDVTVLGQP